MSTPIPGLITFAVEPEGIGSYQIAAWVFAPQNVSELLPSMWVLCIPGGTYRGLAYFDRQVPGCASFAYSMARWLASQGIGLVVIDNLGTGASRIDVSGSLFTRQVYATTYRQLVAQLRELLTAGKLLPRQQPIAPERLWLCGLGHSMGGLLVTQTQGEYDCFDAVALLGWASREDVVPFGVEAQLFLSQLEQFLLHEQDGWLTFDRRFMRPLFYSLHVPSTLIEVDEDDATFIPSRLLRDLIQPGVVAPQAAQICRPVYLAFAEKMDVTLDPRAEAEAYASATSITLFIQPGAHHCANFEQGRFDLWNDLAAWMRAKAVQAKGRGQVPYALTMGTEAEASTTTQPLAV